MKEAMTVNYRESRKMSVHNPNKPPQPLTAKEKLTLEFIETFIRKHGIAPSYQEIKNHFGFASYNSVQRYLKQLQKKNYIHMPGGNQKRAISLLHSASALQSQVLQHTTKNSISHTPRTPEPLLHFLPQAVGALALPLLGRVAAGKPMEALEYNEFVEAPSSMLRQPQQSFALKVEGESMVEDGIFDGDTILVQEQSQAKNGDLVVATVDNEATVKRFYLHKDKVELRPANSEMESMWFSPEQVEIKGIVVGLIRKF
jgi:repressor LexA